MGNQGDVGSVFDKPEPKKKKGPGRPKKREPKFRKHYYFTKTTINTLENLARDLKLDYSDLAEKLINFGFNNIELIDVYNK